MKQTTDLPPWLRSGVALWSGVIALLIMLIGLLTTARKRAEALRQLNETLEQRVTERTAFLQLLQEVTAAANEAATIEFAMQFVLDQVCAHAGWPVGHVYLLAEGGAGELIPTPIWHLDPPERFEPFRQLTERSRFVSGRDLPGRVLASGEPAWIIDVTRDENFPRAQAAEVSGLKAGFAFPVWAGQEVVAVLEFFAVEAIKPTGPLLEVMTHVGTQLGRVIERQRAEERIRENEQQLAEAQAIAHMGSWQWDMPANRLNWSDELYRIYGLEPQTFQLSYESFLERVHPEDRERVRRIVEAASASHQSFSFTHRIIRSDGRVRMLQTKGKVVLDGASQPIKMIGTGQDITSQKKAEEQIHRLNAELEQRITERTRQLEATNRELEEEAIERQLTETALRESEERYRELVELSPDALFIRSGDQITFINTAGVKLLGATSPDQLIGKPVMDIVHPDYHDIVQQRIQQGNAGLTTPLLEQKFIRLDGTVIDVEVVTTLLAYSDQPVVQVIARDITARKQAELAQHLLAEAGQALAASLDYEANLTHLVHLIVPHLADWCVMDMLGDDNLIHRLAVVHADPTRAELAQQLQHRYPVLDSEGRHTILKVLRGGQGWLDAEVTATRLAAEARDSEHLRLLQGLGFHSEMVVPLVARGRTLGTITFVWAKPGRRYGPADLALAEELARRAALAVDNARLYREAQRLNEELEQRVRERTAELRAANAQLESEITERWRTEEGLRQSEARFSTIFHTSPVAICVTTLAEGRFLDVNESYLELLGYRREEVIGRTSTELGILTNPEERPHFTQTLREQNSVRNIESNYRAKSGEIRQTLASAELIDLGDEACILTLIYDITERKQMELELAEVQHRLLESRERERQRLAMELHDGPVQDLHSVSFRLGGLKEALQDETDLAQLAAAQMTLHGVIQVLRAIFGELRPPTLAPFGLEKAIRSHAERFQAAHPELDIRLALMPDKQTLPEPMRFALFRIYQEMLNNVVRHAGAEQVWIRLALDTEQVILEAQDDGCGFEAPQRWIQLARQGHLGLVGMSERAEALGGRLQIISASGAGTTVRVVVPRASEAESAP